MKIKKKTRKNSQRQPDDDKDSGIFLRVVLIIVVIDIVLYFTALPWIENMMASSLDPNTSDSGLMFKTTLLTILDITLFVSLYMYFSRKQARADRK